MNIAIIFFFFPSSSLLPFLSILLALITSPLFGWVVDLTHKRGILGIYLPFLSSSLYRYMDNDQFFLSFFLSFIELNPFSSLSFHLNSHIRQHVGSDSLFAARFDGHQSPPRDHHVGYPFRVNASSSLPLHSPLGPS